MADARKRAAVAIGVYRYLSVIHASHETPKIKHAVHHVRILLNDTRESL
jgi:hypothetical protein